MVSQKKMFNNIKWSQIVMLARLCNVQLVQLNSQISENKY